MKQAFLFTIIILSTGASLRAQRIAQVPDSVRKKIQASNARENQRNVPDISKLDQDSLIKVKLVQLAQANTTVVVADANIRIAEANLALAKKGWLSSVTAGANINEFVVQGSSLASFFPKYNLGIAVPFDILAKMKREKRLAQENLLINNEAKKDKLQYLRTEVLISYETYKERKELVVIQKNSIEYDYSAYLAAQNAYSQGDAKVEEMDKAYQTYLGQKVLLVSKELDLKIAVIQLEQLIGTPLDAAIAQATKL